MNDYLNKIKTASVSIVESFNKQLVDVVLRKEFGVNFISVIIDDPLTFQTDIDEVASINEKILDLVNDDIPDGYYLEVTTPGIERELLTDEDYSKAIGKYIYIKTYQKIDENKEFYGDLIEYSNDFVLIEAVFKQRKKLVNIPKSAIAKIRLAVKF